MLKTKHDLLDKISSHLSIVSKDVEIETLFVNQNFTSYIGKLNKIYQFKILSNLSDGNKEFEIEK